MVFLSDLYESYARYHVNISLFLFSVAVLSSGCYWLQYLPYDFVSVQAVGSNPTNMGCFFSNLARFLGSKLDDAEVISKRIDREIMTQHRNEPDEIELLVLGAGESGKSTLLKQMRIIHKSDYTLEEKLMFKPVVYANTIQSMSIILHAVERYGKFSKAASFPSSFLVRVCFSFQLQGDFAMFLIFIKST